LTHTHHKSVTIIIGLICHNNIDSFYLYILHNQFQTPSFSCKLVQNVSSGRHVIAEVSEKPVLQCRLVQDDLTREQHLRWPTLEFNRPNNCLIPLWTRIFC